MSDGCLILPLHNTIKFDQNEKWEQLVALININKYDKNMAFN